MALSAFDDPKAPPSDRDLSQRLGAAAPAWSALLSKLRQDVDGLDEVWGFAGAKFGWSLRVRRKERVLLYLTPSDGSFLAGIVLGEKAVAAARGAGLPDALLARIEAAPRYAEGRGLRIPLGPGDDVEPIRRLVALKLAPEPPRARKAGAPASRPKRRS